MLETQRNLLLRVLSIATIQWNRKNEKANSVVSCMQRVSVNLQNSLLPSLYDSNPLHITVLKFAKNIRQKQTVSRFSVVSNYPAVYSELHEVQNRRK